MPRAVQARSAKTLASILTAAKALIDRRGVGSLTMDAVAAEAGVSKGGLLHHFRSKEALIAGLVARKMQDMRERQAKEEEAVAGAPNAALLGVIRQSASQYSDESGFPTSLLVAAVQDAACLAEIRAMMAGDLARIGAESPRPDEGRMLFFATLGLMLSRALGFSSLADDEARQLFAVIEASARGPAT
jgi:AcrR family transcriptional regulator